MGRTEPKSAHPNAALRDQVGYHHLFLDVSPLHIFRRDHYFVDLAKERDRERERESVPQLLIAFLNSSLNTLILKILIYIIILYLIIQSNVFKIISIFRVNFVFFGNISFIFIKLNILLFILYFIKNH